jgi:hypothetical protein
MDPLGPHANVFEPEIGMSSGDRSPGSDPRGLHRCVLAGNCVQVAHDLRRISGAAVQDPGAASQMPRRPVPLRDAPCAASVASDPIDAPAEPPGRGAPHGERRSSAPAPSQPIRSGLPTRCSSQQLTRSPRARLTSGITGANSREAGTCERFGAARRRGGDAARGVVRARECSRLCTAPGSGGARHRRVMRRGSMRRSA